MASLLYQARSVRHNTKEATTKWNSMGLTSKGNHWRRLLAPAALVFAFGTWPGGTLAQPNGCGSGWNQPFVPDGIRPLGCSFRQACDRHDACYGRCAEPLKPGQQRSPQCEYLDCEPGGRLAGQAVCDTVRFHQLRLEANRRRTKCDAAFMVDLDDANAGKPRCLLFTAFYPFMVRLRGGSAFVGVEVSQTLVPPAERKSYIDAFNDMLTTWSDDQLLSYAKRLREGDVKEDFSGPIVFDRAKGFRRADP